MAPSPPTVLILGHSFVKRLRRDLSNGFDQRANENFHLHGTASVHLHGIGGCTVLKLRQHDLHIVSSLAPDAIISEIGMNDLSIKSPEVIGSKIEDLVQILLESFSAQVVGICHVIPRGQTYAQFSNFNESASILNHYVSVVLEQFSNVFCWRHRGFHNPSKNPFLADGVHVNPSGQYCLYRSYRGAILKALGML